MLQSPMLRAFLPPVGQNDKKSFQKIILFMLFLNSKSIDKITHNVLKYKSVRFLQLTGSGLNRMGAKIISVDRLGNSTFKQGGIALFCLNVKKGDRL